MTCMHCPDNDDFKQQKQQQYYHCPYADCRIPYLNITDIFLHPGHGNIQSEDGLSIYRFKDKCFLSKQACMEYIQRKTGMQGCSLYNQETEWPANSLEHMKLFLRNKKRTRIRMARAYRLSHSHFIKFKYKMVDG